MKMRILKKVAALTLMAIMCAGVFTGCGKPGASASETKEDVNSAAEGDSQQPESQQEETKQLSGAVTMAGSTSMEKFCTALIEVFMEANPNVTINSEYIGSSAGLEALAAGSADVGNASRALKDSELATGAVDNVVALDGIAVIVDKSNEVGNLTKEQLTQIYLGEIKNWSEVGGASAPIVVVGREAGSGTRGAFEELLKVEDACAYANELDSTGAVMAKVGSTPGAIGYVSLDVLNDSVNAVSLEGSEPTSDNIIAGNYFLSRPFVMATMGEISEQNEIVQAIFAYIASSEGKTLIESIGLINVD